MLNLYWHTIKHLRAQQIFYQIFYRLYKPSLKFCKDSSIDEFLPLQTSWPQASVCAASLSDDLEFSALNISAKITDPNIWNSKKLAKLWLYNLHYFDVLRSDAQAFKLKKYIAIWLENNSEGKGCGWEPYPIAIRVINWIKWFSETGIYEKEWLDSLAMQSEYLFRRVEYHILGNHILTNAKALVFVGSFFVGKRAQAWLQKGIRLLQKELAAQFLVDGGHFELSPMYHAILLWDLCDLINLAGQTKNIALQNLVPCLQEKLKRGLIWLQTMSHPDGDIAFFNDATFGIAPSYKEILAYAKYLHVVDTEQLNSLNSTSNLTIESLPDSGYYIVGLPANGKAILDIAKVGADYQPGHAHADTLSFELSLFGKRFIVNSGVSEYGLGSLRLLQRGTIAHTTVNVNSKNSSEIWHGFRVARRANPKLQLLEKDLYEVTIQGSHDGYRLLDPLLRHSRLWQFTANSLLVTDNISVDATENEARYYFHPMVVIEKQGDAVNCYLDNNLVCIKLGGAQSILLAESFWYPGFGKKCANKCLVVKFHKRELQTHIAW